MNDVAFQPELHHRQHRTLGTLLADIELIHPRRDGLVDPGPVRVVFDFCGFAPNGINAYGLFGDLALGFADLHPEQRPTVEQLVNVLRGALHQTFHYAGGGRHRGHIRSPLWVGNPGQESHTLIVGASRCANGLVLHTDIWEVVG